MGGGESVWFPVWSTGGNDRSNCDCACLGGLIGRGGDVGLAGSEAVEGFRFELEAAFFRFDGPKRGMLNCSSYLELNATVRS